MLMVLPLGFPVRDCGLIATCVVRNRFLELKHSALAFLLEVQIQLPINRAQD